MSWQLNIALTKDCVCVFERVGWVETLDHSFFRTTGSFNVYLEYEI